MDKDRQGQTSCFWALLLPRYPDPETIMTAKLLTPRTVETAKPGLNAAGKLVRAEIPDTGCPGLYLVVQPSGTRSWALRYRRPGNSTSAKLTLGRAGNGGLNLAAARHAATAARLCIDGGGDPKPKRLPITAYASGDAIESAIGSFLDLHARKKNRPTTVFAAESIFARCVLPAWRGRSVHDIRRRDVIELIERIATDRPYLANRALGVLSKFFRWLQSRDVIETAPTAGVVRPHKEEPRQHTLTDEELKRLWVVSDNDRPFGAALRMLVLTGARRNEVSRMRWCELDDQRRMWILPRERAKNGIEHRVPLSRQAWEIIAAQPRFDGCPYVFSANGRDPVIGWAKAKTRLSAKAGIAEESWRLHDLRRSCATGLQRLNIPVPVIERALNHVSGVFRGVTGIYQVHTYESEIQVALQRWADHVEQLVHRQAREGH
jgi:integrase